MKNCQEQLQLLLRDATVSIVEGGFVIHGYKSHSKAVPTEYKLPRDQTLASEGFWVAHPFSDNAYRFVGEWLLKN